MGIMIEGRKKDIKENNEAHRYQGLLAAKVMEILNKGKDAKERQIKTDAAVLTVNTQTFLDLIKEGDSAGGEEIFIKVNQILNKLIPVVLKKQGVIERFTGGGLRAFYPESAEAALQTAIEISKVMEEDNAYSNRIDNAYSIGINNDYSIGVSYGTLIIGIVGNEQAFSGEVISEYMGLSEYLQTIARDYYARSLLCESFVSRIPGFEKEYEQRFLGYLYIKKSGQLKKIYDFYGIDVKEVRWLKRKTALMFGEGIKWYVNRDYQMARSHFIEVLKINRYDSAARKYLYLCEHYLEQGIDGEIYFECY